MWGAAFIIREKDWGEPQTRLRFGSLAQLIDDRNSDGPRKSWMGFKSIHVRDTPDSSLKAECAFLFLLLPLPDEASGIETIITAHLDEYAEEFDQWRRTHPQQKALQHISLKKGRGSSLSSVANPFERGFKSLFGFFRLEEEHHFVENNLNGKAPALIEANFLKYYSSEIDYSNGDVVRGVYSAFDSLGKCRQLCPQRLSESPIDPSSCRSEPKYPEKTVHVIIDRMVTEIPELSRLYWFMNLKGTRSVSPTTKVEYFERSSTGTYKYKVHTSSVTVHFCHDSVNSAGFIQTFGEHLTVYVVAANNESEFRKKKKPLADSASENGPISMGHLFQTIANAFHVAGRKWTSRKDVDPKDVDLIIVNEKTEKVKIEGEALYSPQHPFVIWDCIWEVIFSKALLEFTDLGGVKFGNNLG
jgi:hypothetical protein